jgi:hypothetical protein
MRQLAHKKTPETESELHDCQNVFHGAPQIEIRTCNAGRRDESSLKS